MSARNRTEEIPEAIADGQFFDMQTLSGALIDLVLSGAVERETAASAALNRHDFLLALERAEKAMEAAKKAANEPAMDDLPRLRLAANSERQPA